MRRESIEMSAYSKTVAPIALYLIAAALCASACPAAAQVSYNTPGRSPYGGGLIEFLVTGNDRAAASAPFAPARRSAAYGAEPGVGAVSREIDPVFRRQEVAYEGREAPGTIVVDTPSRFLYHVHGNGSATRYGIGVGRPGFAWAGIKTVSMKREWPDWTPPAEMVARRPDLPRHMEGGPENPLGARAMYLGSSLYRIHGTNEPWTIGQNVSSGCIRMMNDDVVDLYERVRVGTLVKVI